MCDFYCQHKTHYHTVVNLLFLGWYVLINFIWRLFGKEYTNRKFMLAVKVTLLTVKSLPT